MAGSALVWFREDLRTSDNPALSAAAATGAPVLCFFILDERSPGPRRLGAAARWWLHGSLEALDQALRRFGSELLVFAGEAPEIIDRIVAETRAGSIYWNRRYTAAETALDAAVKKRLLAKGLTVESFNGRLLNEPWAVTNKAGKPFQVFTPYLRTVLERMPAGRPLPVPSELKPGTWPATVRHAGRTIHDLELEPRNPDWAKPFHEVWTRGEGAAQSRLRAFLRNGLTAYAENRDHPATAGTSRLSPHLRSGDISPRQVWHAVHAAVQVGGGSIHAGADKLLSEVIWRDFCYQLLFQDPDLATRSSSARFERVPWSGKKQDLRAWQQGRTGYPIVDAGMRQLWRTGWMPNRVRMITASFLVKHLLTDWRLGEKWFWDTLIDADPANNAFNWQWIAGSGPDAAPFHRIFNPITQAAKFDSDGEYVRAHVPELSGLPSSLIHEPWKASTPILHSAGITLGTTYPQPIVALEHGRERALDAFRSTRAAPD